MYIISQIVGAFGLGASVISFQKKDRSGIMFFQVIASLLFAIQLFLVGAFTGAYLDIVSFGRTMVFANKGKKWASSNVWIYLFMSLQILVGIFTYQNIFSVFAILGSILSTIALWMKESKHIRLVSLFVGPCWIVYNLVWGAYTGVINEIIAMTSIIIGIYRYDKSY